MQCNKDVVSACWLVISHKVNDKYSKFVRELKFKFLEYR